MKNLLFDVFDFLTGTKGITFAELYLENAETEQIILEQSRIESLKRGSITGLGIRFTRGDEQFFLATNDIRRDSILAKLESIIKAGDMSGSASTREIENFDYINSIKKPNDALDLSQKQDILLQYDQFMRGKKPNITQCTLRYVYAKKNITILSTDTGFKNQQLNYTTFSVQLISEKDNELCNVYEAYGGLRGLEVLEERQTDLEKLLERLNNMEYARDIRPGNMPVIIASEAGGTLIHEAIGHSLEADLVYKGLSQFKGKLNKKIFNDNITIVDDATLKGARGSYHFDDEGTPSQRTVLVEKGVLKTYLTDRYHSQKLGIKPTGNGRRQDFAYKPIPRMSNTILVPDDTANATSLEDLVKEIKNEGIIVKKVGGGQVDTLTGIFIFEINEGYYVNQGKIQFPVKHAVMMGNSAKTLNNIVAMSNELDFGIGTCGKDGQGVPVSDAQPSILISQLTIGGKKD